MTDKIDNISDEMLAAYTDGNATPLESLIIENSLNNEDIMEVMDIISDMQNYSELLKEEGFSESKILNNIELFKELRRKLNEGRENNIM